MYLIDSELRSGCVLFFTLTLSHRGFFPQFFSVYSCKNKSFTFKVPCKHISCVFEVGGLFIYWELSSFWQKSRGVIDRELDWRVSSNASLFSIEDIIFQNYSAETSQFQKRNWLTRFIGVELKKFFWGSYCHFVYCKCINYLPLEISQIWLHYILHL